MMPIKQSCQAWNIDSFWTFLDIFHQISSNINTVRSQEAGPYIGRGLAASHYSFVWIQSVTLNWEQEENVVDVSASPPDKVIHVDRSNRSNNM